jgi:hypothetical protein
VPRFWPPAVIVWGSLLLIHRHAQRYPATNLFPAGTKLEARSPGPRSPGPRSPGPRSPGPRSPGPRSPGPRSPGKLEARSPGPRSPGPRSPGKLEARSPGPRSPGKLEALVLEALVLEALVSSKLEARSPGPRSPGPRSSERIAAAMPEGIAAAIGRPARSGYANHPSARAWSRVLFGPFHRSPTTCPGASCDRKS